MRRAVCGIAICRIIILVLGGLHVHEVGPLQVLEAKDPENVVHDGGGHLDVGMALDLTLRRKAGEGEGVHKLLERYPVLESLGDGDGKAVHASAEGCSFLVHVDEDLAELAILVIARPEINLVPSHPRFLGEATPLRRELASDSQ